MMAELYSKETGYCRGKGGSMHIVDFGLGVLGANGIVGAGLPIATGAALSAKLRGTYQVALSSFGDGATNIGAFHEALNLAATWQLPVIFLCQNNEYGESTPRRAQQRIADIADRAAGYGMPGAVVDGMDVLAVHAAVADAVGRARAGDGPTLVEAKTYRFLGHYVGDAEAYRTKAEVEQWRRRDPVLSFRDRLVEQGVLDAGKDIVEAEARAVVNEAVDFARRSEPAAVEAAFEDVLT
jgi:pyruvate dehydrogenase E1 component alpha subunit